MTTQVSFSEELMNKGLSDQNPIVLTQITEISFQILQCLAKDNEFFSIVHNAWATPIAGPMLSLLGGNLNSFHLLTHRKPTIF